MFLKITCLVSLSLLLMVTASKDTDKSKCAGPIAFYESLNCKPEYENPKTNCPTSYNCTHLDVTRKSDKCYMKNNEYSIGEKIKKEHEDVCGTDCTCIMMNKTPYVDCKKITTCPRRRNPTPHGCYLDYSVNKCCGEVICPKADNITMCEVEGKIFKEGIYFNPPSQPYVKCHCLPGFKGEIAEPFCQKDSCSYYMDDINVYKYRSAPIFEFSQNVAKDCSILRKSPQPQDVILPNPNADKFFLASKMCEHGKLRLKVGDELKQNGPSDAECKLRCRCEVPPLLSCQFTSKKCSEPMGPSTSSSYLY